MERFEGYVGIRLWDGQMVDDLLFSLLLALFILFAWMFRFHYSHFLNMLSRVAFMKERPHLFDKGAGSGWVFRHFMIFQALSLAAIGVFAVGRGYGYLNYLQEHIVLRTVGGLFAVLWAFYVAKQSFYFVFGLVFADPVKYRFWKANYNAVMATWGVLMYIPVVWLVFVGESLAIPALLFAILYILCRFVIIYKTIRIFHTRSTGILYISLYLCGQEILPLVFLYKGIVYLYNFIEATTLWH